MGFRRRQHVHCPNPSHSYSAADTYTVQLTVTDDDGDRDSISQMSPSLTVSECSETMTLSAGEVKAFALPCDPGNSTVAEVFTAFDMNAMGGAWGIYYVDNAAKQPVILTPESTLPVGVFYAIKSNLDTTVTVNGSNIPAMNIPLTESSTQVGGGDWNFIGYTGRASRPWAEVIPMDGPDNKDWAWADRWRNNLIHSSAI